MTDDNGPERRSGRSHRWKMIYFLIVALTAVVYLLLWIFSQAFFR